MNLAYVAGLIDGEGCIQFTRSRSAYIPRVSITNTNLELLEDLKATFGGHIQKLWGRKEGWKQAYAWIIQNTKAVNFVESLESWVRIKQEQIWLFYAWEEIRPGYNYKWTSEALEAIELINAQSKWLNWRGCHRPSVIPMDLELNNFPHR